MFSLFCFRVGTSCDVPVQLQMTEHLNQSTNLCLKSFFSFALFLEEGVGVRLMSIYFNLKKSNYKEKRWGLWSENCTHIFPLC